MDSSPIPKKSEFHSWSLILSAAALIVEDAGNPIITDPRDRTAALKDALALIDRTKACINEAILKETVFPQTPPRITSGGRQIRYKDGTFGPVRSIGNNQPELSFRPIRKKK